MATVGGPGEGRGDRGFDGLIFSISKLLQLHFEVAKTNCRCCLEDSGQWPEWFKSSHWLGYENSNGCFA